VVWYAGVAGRFRQYGIGEGNVKKVTSPKPIFLSMLKFPPSVTFSIVKAFNNIHPFYTHKAMLTILITSGIVMLIRRLRGTK